MENNNPFLQKIYISPGQGEPMVNVPEVMALEGVGLDGDRYAANDGFWQNVPNARPAKRDVSIISAQAIEDSNFEPEETRRNLVIAGDINLVDLIGKEFSIGEVLFIGAEECTPCKRPSDLSGKDGFAKEFKGKGGLRAEIASWGTLHEGDELRIPTDK